jgi:hypothetical protein
MEDMKKTRKWFEVDGNSSFKTLEKEEENKESLPREDDKK